MFGIRSSIYKLILPDVLKQQTRNTFILKRKNPVPLYPQHRHQIEPRMLKAKHFIYELVQDTGVLKKPNLNVILTQFVDGYGNAGDVLSLRPGTAYRYFLMPGLAVYASPQNKKKYLDSNRQMGEAQYSSPFVHRTMKFLNGYLCVIFMNSAIPWTLEPWHIETSFRRDFVVVPEHTITMPPVAISGPDPSLYDKEFFITVTINNREKVNVRCRIHQWANNATERVPLQKNHFEIPKEPLIPEQAEVLASMPLPVAETQKK